MFLKWLLFKKGDLAETVKKNQEFIDLKTEQLSNHNDDMTNKTSPPPPNSNKILSRSNSSSSSHTSYQDLPSCLHESFTECRNRLTGRLESFERHQQDEVTQTSSFFEKQDHSIYPPSSPIPPINSANILNLSKDDDLLNLKRNYTSSYLEYSNIY